MREDLARHAYVWRLVREGVATLTEIETGWNMDDILRGNAILDRESDAAYIASKRQPKPGKGARA